jgi:hypothetical protein
MGEWDDVLQRFIQLLPAHQPKLMGSIIQIDAIRPLYWRSHYRENHINE